MESGLVKGLGVVLEPYSEARALLPCLVPDVGFLIMKYKFEIADVGVNIDNLVILDADRYGKLLGIEIVISYRHWLRDAPLSLPRIKKYASLKLTEETTGKAFLELPVQVTASPDVSRVLIRFTQDELGPAYGLSEMCAAYVQNGMVQAFFADLSGKCFINNTLNGFD